MATLYGYDALGRTALVTETGILTGTFNLSTLTFSDRTTRTTRTEYDALSRPVTTTLNYRPGLPTTADTNLQLLTRYDGAGNVIWQRDAYGRWTKTDYDARNRPIRTIQNYEDGDPLTGDRDADLISETQYDGAGRIERQIDNVVDGLFTATEPITDRVTLFQYDGLGRTITTTLNLDPPTLGTRNDTNRVHLSAYDPISGRMLGQRDALGRWSSQQYDVLGRVQTTIQNCRDAAGNPVATTCAAFTSATPDRNLRTQTSYDALGRVDTTTDPLSVVARFQFDGLGRTTTSIQNYVFGGAVDAETNVTSSTTFDALGQAITVTDAAGKISHMQYNGLGFTTTMTDTLNRVTRQGYDGQGTMRWSRTPDGRVSITQVDGLGRVVTTIQNYQDGVVAGNEPVDQDLITRTVYDLAGRRIQAVDARGLVTQFDYDNLDRLITVMEHATTGTCTLAPCNVTTGYVYDRAGNRTAITDANGHTRRFTYDAANQMLTAVDALGTITTYSYDAGGRLTGTIDPRGTTNNLTYGYDQVDRPTTVSASNLGTITQHYDARGQRTSLIDDTGTTSFDYDPLGRMTHVTAPNTGSVGYQYDARGLRTRVTYPGGAPAIDYTYVDDGQLDLVKQGTTTLADYSYDAVGRVQQVARANGTTTTYGYDEADRPNAISTTLGGAPVSSFAYTLNRNGLRTNVTETVGVVSSGTLTSTTALSARPWVSATNGWGPVELNESLGEDLASDGTTLTLNGVTYASGLGVAPDSTIVYDLGGVCSSFQADLGVDDEVSGSLPSVVFQVQLDGTTLYTSSTMTASSTTQSINLNVSGGHVLRLIVTDAGDGPGEDHADWANARVTCTATSVVENLSDRSWSSATNGWGPVELNESLGEDLASDGTTITLNGVPYPKGLGVAPDSTIVYDLHGACTNFAADIGVDDEITGNLASVVFTVVGDSATLYTSGTLTPSSATTSVSLDVTGVDQLELTVADAGDGPGEDHADWAGARVTCAAGSGGTSRTISYGYDGLQRLTGAVESGATTNTYAYGYDDAGNRTSVTVNGVTTTRSYNAANQVSGWTYDDAGNLTSDGTNTYTYDALNRLTNQGTTTNAYNGDSTLVAQTVSGVTTRYTQDLALPLSQILSDGTTTYVYGMDRLYGVAGSTRTWYGSDALGSVRQTLNDSGSVLGTANYDPYGQVQSGLVGAFGFTGELQQGNSVYLRARWYNSAAGTFTAHDPFAGFSEQPYSLHQYQYGYSNPVSNTDPSGKTVCVLGFLAPGPGWVAGAVCLVVQIGGLAVAAWAGNQIGQFVGESLQTPSHTGHEPPLPPTALGTPPITSQYPQVDDYMSADPFPSENTPCPETFPLDLVDRGSLRSVQWPNAAQQRGPVVLAATYGQAKRWLLDGADSVEVNSRVVAEKLLKELYEGYTDITSENPVLAKRSRGSLARTYHWDDQIYGAGVPIPKDQRGRPMEEYRGRLAWHDLDDAHSRQRHLQIRNAQDRTIRIFWGPFIW